MPGLWFRVSEFSAFPPTNPIKGISQLSKAVLNGDYHCVIHPKSTFNDLFQTSTSEILKIIERDIKTNNLDYGKLFKPFLFENTNKKIAFIVDSEAVSMIRVGNKFVSEDRFSEIMVGMMIRKDFCCKKVIETFVHRLTASGLYFKYQSDRSFLLRLPLLLKYSEEDTRKRKLVLTDVAPAFIVLLTGYFLSFLIFIVEMLTNPRKKVNSLKKKKEKKIEIYVEDSI